MKLEFLQKELDRVNDWNKFADKKSGFLFAVYSIIIGFLKYNILNLDNILLCILFLLIFISTLFGFYFLVRSLFPKNKNYLTDENILFFGNVSDMKYKDFFDKYENITEEKMKQNFIEQIYTNSIIVNKKFGYIKKSIICLIISVISLLIFLIIK